jgi:hypothetical protein
METTISVRESTAQVLLRLKKKFGARNIDSIIVELLAKSGEIPSSRFGSNPKLKEFSKKDRGTFREL